MKFNAIYEWVRDNPDTRSASRKQECEFLYNLVLENPDITRKGRLLEVGSYCCASTNVLAAAAEELNHEIHAVDLAKFGGAQSVVIHPDIYHNKTWIHPRLKDRVTFRVCDSMEMIREWYDQKIPVSFAFVDGCHDTDQVVQEMRLLQEMVIDEGCIACHDADWGSVRTALDRMTWDKWIGIKTPFALGELTPTVDGKLIPSTTTAGDGTVPPHEFLETWRPCYWTVKAWRKHGSI